MRRYRLSENIGLKISALFFAFLLWLLVVNFDDPVDTDTYNGIPVIVTNEQVVSNEGKVYQILDGTESVSVKVTAKRSVLEKITKEDIVAEADMREMQIESLIPIEAVVKGYEGKCKTEVTPNNLSVRIDDVKSKTFPVTVSTTGTPQDGCSIGTMTPHPEKITFSGSDVLINRIDSVVVKIDVTGVSENTTLTGELILYDSQENVIAQNKLKNNIGENGVQVDVEVLNTKNIFVNFEVKGTPQEGYVYTGLSSEPSRIQVLGRKEDLENLMEIDVPAIDITGISAKEEVTIDILPYLPEDIRLADETANNIVVTIFIEEEGTKTVEFPVDSIRVNNLSDKLEVSFEPLINLELKFRGSEEKLAALDITNAVSVDLKKFTTPGSYTVPIDVEVPSGIALSDKMEIQIKLTEKKDEH